MERRRTRLGLAALTAVALVVSGLAPQRTERAAATTDPTVPSSWAAEWMIREGDTYTATEAAGLARRYDLLIAHTNTFQGRVASMRAANPNVQLHAYVNGAFAASYLPPYPEAWYAHNAAGKRVLAVRFGTYLMNVHTTNWRAEVVKLCDNAIATSGYEGCFIDSLGNGQLASDYLDSDPIDPRTGQVWDLERWIRDTAALVTYVRQQRPNMPISVNGLGNGPRYFSSATHQLAAASPLAMAESFLRGATAPIGDWPGVTEWQKNVDMLVDAEAMGTGVLAVTKIWTNATTAQRRQWYGYTLGTFLLGAGTASHLYFLKDGCAPPCSNTASPLADQWIPEMQLGAPTGPYRASGSAFVRDFANGMVAVNPTSATTTVPVPPGTYVDQDGKGVNTTLTLPPRTGSVITPGVPAGSLTCGGKVATIVGTNGDDTLVGTSGPDVIRAMNGDDLIDGGGGDDYICGDYGNDTVHGGAGDDRIFDTGGDDFVDGGDGDDDVTAGSGVDQVVGGLGNDVLHGGGSNDVLTDAGGDDFLDGGTGDDQLLAGPGIDQVIGGGGLDELRGAAGTDILRGGADNDLLYGEADNDTLHGDGGADTCNGGTGTDTAGTSCETRVATE